MTGRALNVRVGVTIALPKVKAALGKLKKPNYGAIILLGKNEI
jgi:hypothetical protein